MNRARDPNMRRGEADPDEGVRIQGTQVLGRAIEVLKTVAKMQRSGASLAAITHSMGLSRSTAFRIVHFLHDAKMLGYDAELGTYHIGPLAYELGLAAIGPAKIAHRWRERIERIARLTGMTTYLTARSEFEVVCLAVAEGQSVIRTVPLTPGDRLPLGVGAGSLAILSALDDDELDTAIRYNARKLQTYPGSGLTPELLRQRIAVTRSEGYAYSEESVAKGVAGVGIAFMSEHGVTALAVSVSAIPAKFEPSRRRELASLIQQVAQENTS